MLMLVLWLCVREQRPFRCEECDVGFKLRVHLKKHNLYRHSDLYQCECRHCGKRFKDSSAVRLHERIHSNDRPFPCPTCGKTFKTRENLWGHRHRGPCGLLLNQVRAAIDCSCSHSISTIRCRKVVDLLYPGTKVVQKLYNNLIHNKSDQ